MKKGVTIVELLVVIGIISLFAFVSLPYLRQYQADVKLKGEARTLASNLRYAQQLAVTEQVIYAVEFDTLYHQYSIINTNLSQTIKTISLEAEIQFQEVRDLTDNTAYFTATGAAQEPGEIILINKKNNTITVEIKPSGYIKIYK